MQSRSRRCFSKCLFISVLFVWEMSRFYVCCTFEINLLLARISSKSLICPSLSFQLFLKLHQDFKRLYFLGKKGRSLENICPVGDPLRISDTVRPFLCGNDPGKPTCPPLYQCLVQKGNDYGVCCPASLKIQKSGQCPVKVENKELECGSMCSHDLECPSVQKCCQTDQCGSSCMHPKNVTGKFLIVLMPLN